jgi:hypothetical protein
VVNFYIRSLWAAPGRFDGETLGRLPNGCTRLQSFHMDQALRQALAIVNSTRKAAAVTGATAKRPVFKKVQQYSATVLVSRMAAATSI